MQKLENNLRKWDQYAGMVALIVLLIPQVQHTVYIFEHNSQYESTWFSWCYALGIDMAILIFTLKGWKRTAIGYLIATFATNFIYQFYPIGWQAKILLCLLLSITLYFFSELYKKEKEQKEDEQKQKSEEDEIQKIMEEARDLGIQVRVNPYLCPSCHESFASKKQLNGHVSGHRNKAKKNPIEWDESKYGNWEQDNDERAKYMLDNIESINKTIGQAA